MKLRLFRLRRLTLDAALNRSISRFSCLLLSASLAFMFSASRLLAETTNQATAVSGAAATDHAASSRFLHVTIVPSTSHLILGAVYGMSADFENVSDAPLTVNLRNLTIETQPELAPMNTICAWSYSAHGPFEELVLQPGDKSTVTFLTGLPVQQVDLKDFSECKADRWSLIRRNLDFIPGPYAFTLIGSFRIMDTMPKVAKPGEVVRKPAPPLAADASLSPGSQHYFSETALLTVAMGQSSLVLYASFGGLVALFVDLYIKRQFGLRFFLSFSFFSRVLGSMLVSATVTAISSRLSTTSFPVKISVEDFWGALTVGFVAYFLGARFLEKLTGADNSGGSHGSSQKGTPAAPVENGGGKVPVPANGVPRDEEGAESEAERNEWFGRLSERFGWGRPAVGDAENDDRHTPHID